MFSCPVRLHSSLFIIVSLRKQPMPCISLTYKTATAGWVLQGDSGHD